MGSEAGRFGPRGLRHAVAIEFQEQRVDSFLALRVILNLVHGEIFGRGFSLLQDQRLELSEKFCLSAHTTSLGPRAREFGANDHEGP